MTQLQPPPAGSPYPGGPPPGSPYQSGSPYQGGSPYPGGSSYPGGGSPYQGGVPYQGGPQPAGLGGPGGMPPQYPYPQGKTNTLAIVALILAFVLAPVGLILGIVALGQIKKRGESGKGLAVAGVVLGAIFTLIGIGAVLLAVFATPTLDTSSVETQISTTTQQAIGTTPTAVTCPDSVEVRPGATFTCTAVAEGQNLPYTVTQKDDQGNVTFERTGWTIVADAEKELTAAATRNFPDNQWTTTCANGKRAFVGGPGTTFSCTLAVATNPIQSEDHTVRVTNNSGGYTIE